MSWLKDFDNMQETSRYDFCQTFVWTVFWICLCISIVGSSYFSKKAPISISVKEEPSQEIEDGKGIPVGQKER